VCERLPGESRVQMLGRLYNRASMRADIEQLRRQQAESRAQKAEWIADRALEALGRIDKGEAADLLAEADATHAPVG
jgi:single-stranded DNA-specific DHH superfamily exonuclease